MKFIKEKIQSLQEPLENPKIMIEDQLAKTKVSAEMLVKMKQSSEDFLGRKVNEPAIIIPAYINHAKRQVTIDAKRIEHIASLDVKQIVNEQVAETLKFDYTPVVVYEKLGDGTFDISIIDIPAIHGEYQNETSQPSSGESGEAQPSFLRKSPGC